MPVHTAAPGAPAAEVGGDRSDQMTDDRQESESAASASLNGATPGESSRLLVQYQCHCVNDGTLYWYFGSLLRNHDGSRGRLCWTVTVTRRAGPAGQDSTEGPEHQLGP